MEDEWRPMPEGWEPISEERVWDKINDGWVRMDFQQRRLWEVVKIIPEKWRHAKKHYEHGSWVVAVIGEAVVWYDDIEEEFAMSLWTGYGTIHAGSHGMSGDLQLPLQHIFMRFATPDIGTPPSKIEKAGPKLGKAEKKSSALQSILHLRLISEVTNTQDGWRPISEENIWGKLNDAWSKMSFGQRRVWDIVRIMPERWSLQIKHYDHGLWVVAIVGRMLIWYDDLEEGFRTSLWTRHGAIDEDNSTGGFSLQEQLDYIPRYLDTKFSGPPAEYFR